MFSFLIFILILSILILVHEFGHFIAAKRIGVRVERFSLGFGPKITGIRKSGTTYQICAIPLGGYIKMAGDNWQEYRGKSYEFLSKKPKDKVKVISSGAGLNYLLGLICFCVSLSLGIPDSSTRVGEVIEGYPAQEAGILVGDRIVSVDGKKVEFWPQLVGIIHKKDGKEAKIRLLRDGEALDLVVPTRVEKVEIPAGEEKISLIGIRQGQKKYSPGLAVIMGIKDYLKTTVFYYKVLGLILTGKKSFKQSVTGPIGIYYITSGAMRIGLGSLLYVLAMLNLSLSIVNLLPLPVLDGGHLMLIALEKVRGKALSRRTEELIMRVGFSLLTFLLIFIIYNDMVNFGLWENISRWIGRRF